jgi:hypothetical protein
MGWIQRVLSRELDPQAFAGVWRGTFAGLTFLALDLRCTVDGLEGTMSVGEIEIDERGALQNVTAAENPEPLLNLRIVDQRLLFERQGDSGTDHFEFRLKGIESAQLTPSVREDVRAAGASAIAPFNLRKVP